MDLSPRALQAVTFREKLRGYHPADVDQFLERVAEGIAALQTRLDEALNRAERAERRLADASGGEEAVKRTLVLAQRTADLTLQEAREEAARLTTEAREESHRIAEEAQKALRADVERLEIARQKLQADVAAMQQYAEKERARLRTALAEVVRQLDQAGRRPPPPPALQKVDVPTPAAPRANEPAAPPEEPAPPAAEIEHELPEPPPPQPRPEPAGTLTRPQGPPPGPGRPAGPPSGPPRVIQADT